jgi:RNA polymerase sigma-54 factor
MAGLQQVQSLSLQQTLAPQLQQSLQILQAPTLELRSLLQQELETNPVLEEVPPGDNLDSADAQTAGDADAEFREEFEQLARLDEEWRDYMAQSYTGSSRSSDDEERRQFFFDSIPVQETLQQHLLDQLNTTDLTPTQRKVAELMIGSIEDSGYLQGTVEELAANSGVPLIDILDALQIVQSFHPVGVGARDLRECLLIQLARSGRRNSLEYRIVEHHLDELAKHRFPDIARKLGTSVEHVQRAAKSIAALDPRPGHAFTPDPNRYVLPDASVEKIGDDYAVILNNEQIPHLRIAKAYRDIMANSPSAEAGEYIREKIRSGKFLIKSIHQRQQTIQNIIYELLKRQREFFDLGPSYLKPLTMVEVADAVGVHETTVSRAIHGKYLQTPHGVFELKSFFTPGYKTSDGDALSNTSVKNAIAELVKNEDPRSPLSDKEIVEILQKQGLNIARRTVAKYRGELSILPSNLRRVY